MPPDPLANRCVPTRRPAGSKLGGRSVTREPPRTIHRVRPRATETCPRDLEAGHSFFYDSPPPLRRLRRLRRFRVGRRGGRDAWLALRAVRAKTPQENDGMAAASAP